MLTWFRSLFAWRIVSTAGVWAYSLNTVTGRRAADRINTGGYSPLDWDWLLAGNGMPLIGGVAAWRSAYRDSLPDGLIWG